jgi:hypothetical protein
MATIEMFEDTEHEIIFELIYDADKSIMPAKDVSEAIAGMATAMAITGRITKFDFESIYVFPPEHGSYKLKFAFSKKEQRIVYLAVAAGALSNVISTVFINALSLFGEYTITAFKHPNGDMVANVQKEVVELCNSNEFRKSVTKFASPISEYNQKLTVRADGKTYEIDCNNQYKFIQEEDETILPDLHDGQQYTLHGKLTRMNLESNDMGFLYMGRKLSILPADPEKRVGKEFNQFLENPDVLITGVVVRNSYTVVPIIRVLNMVQFVPPAQVDMFSSEGTISAEIVATPSSTPVVTEPLIE